MDPPAVVEGPERLAVAFARIVRGAGLDVPGGAPVRYAEALAAVGLERRELVYWSGRATLVRRPEDVATYDAVFAAFWDGRIELTPHVVEQVTVPVVVEEDGDEPEAEDDGDAAPSPPAIRLRYSRIEVLRHKDFAECTAAELVEAQRLLAMLRLAGPTRRTRRHRPTSRGARPDLRRTVRHALRTGGEPVRRQWRAPVEGPRRVVFLCDVSGSMSPYARALLRFLHVAVTGRRRVEAFTIGTRLTRVTRTLSLHDPDAALSGAAQTVADWSGGTRLGEALHEFNERWGVRGMARGAVVVVVSDGWDRGDPELLAAEMARLARVAHRVVWVNPLKATPGYAPLVRGMAAALPYVDDFLDGHSLASLEALAKVLAAVDR